MSKRSSGGKGMGKGKGGGMGGGKGGMGGGHSGQGGGKNGDQEEMNAEFEAKMADELEIRLDQNGYCREGYTEIESYFSRGSGQIRGECNEVATEMDRQSFINYQYNRY